MLLAPLDVDGLQIGELATTESAAQQGGQDRSVPGALQGYLDPEPAKENVPRFGSASCLGERPTS